MSQAVLGTKELFIYTGLLAGIHALAYTLAESYGSWAFGCANFLYLLLPLPLVVCLCRHGLRASLAPLLLVVVIDFLLLDPVEAMSFCCKSGLFALILGCCLRRHLAVRDTLIWGLGGFILGVVVYTGFCRLVLGYSPLRVLFLANSQGAPKALLPMMEDAFLVGVLLGGVVQVLLNYWLAKTILRREGEAA